MCKAITSKDSELILKRLGKKLRKVGFSWEDVKKLGSRNLPNQIRHVLLGRARIVPTKHVIDLSFKPDPPLDWEVWHHSKHRDFTWNPARIKLFQSKKQLKDEGVNGRELRLSLENKRVFNINLLHYLLDNQELIPEGWKKYDRILFWGTIFERRGALFVAHLAFFDEEWTYDYNGASTDEHYGIKDVSLCLDR